MTLMTLEAVVDKERPKLQPDMYLGQIVQAIASSKSLHFAVTDRQGSLLGVININNLRKIIFRSELYRMYKAQDLMQQPPAILHTNDSMAVVMDTFQDCSAGTLPVLTPDGKYVGFISRTRLYAHYRQIMKDYSEE